MVLLAVFFLGEPQPKTISSYEQYRDDAERRWGFIVEENQDWTAPLLISEFGTCHYNITCIEDHGQESGNPTLPHGIWFSYISTYLEEIDADFVVWAWNGSTCRGDSRVYGNEEGYGITNVCWNGIALMPYLQRLQEMQQPRLSPRV